MEQRANGKRSQRAGPKLPCAQQNALDGVPPCFMLRRFSRPNRARGKTLQRMGPADGLDALHSDWKVLLKN